MTGRKRMSLDEWVRRLNDEEMPIFAHTARRIAGISADEDTSIAELSRAILQDSSMTARVLRMANSVYFNRSGSVISTVSRGIVMLGFQVVRNMALSIAMVDTMLTGVRHERVHREMARALHAAVQARAFAVARRDPSAEEVFIAALLSRLGHMAFWCFSHGYADDLDALLKKTGVKPADAEREVLGFPLDALTASLNREWKLSPLLEQALEGPKGENPRVGNMELGYRLAVAVEGGWQSTAVATLIDRIAEFVYVSRSEAVRLVHESARSAIKTATDLGAEAAARLIPPPEGDLKHKPDEHGAAAKGETPADLQLQVLRELSAMLREGVDLNTLLGTVLEGVYRALEMDRVVLALVTPHRDAVKLKYALGADDQESLNSCFDLRIGPGARNLVARVIAENRGRWIGPGAPELTGLSEQGCYIEPLCAGGRPIGIIYADRGNAKPPLDQDTHLAFRHFCEQATLGFTFLGRR